MWMMIYPPNTSVGLHCDERKNFNRYVYEIQSTDNSYFEYIMGTKIKKIDSLNNHLLFIGDYLHRYVNNSNSKSRISIVFDTLYPIM